MGYKTIKERITGVYNPVKKLVGGITSAPAQIKAEMSKMQADMDVDTIKKARAYDKAPDKDANGVTDAFKARSMAVAVRDRISKKK